jgi:hypothetical protein
MLEAACFASTNRTQSDDTKADLLVEAQLPEVKSPRAVSTLANLPKLDNHVRVSDPAKLQRSLFTDHTANSLGGNFGAETNA